MKGVLISDAAQRLGVTPKVVHRALRQYQIEPEYLHSNCMILSDRQMKQLIKKLRDENLIRIEKLRSQLERWESI